MVVLHEIERKQKVLYDVSQKKAFNAKSIQNIDKIEL